MPNIPQEYAVAVVGSLVAWLLLKAVNEARVFVKSLEKSKPEAYDVLNTFRLAWKAGEQLIEKHGYTDRAQVEAKVLKFVNEYMISQGFEPPAREMAEMLIRAVGRQYNEARKEIGEE